MVSIFLTEKNEFVLKLHNLCHSNQAEQYQYFLFIFIKDTVGEDVDLRYFDATTSNEIAKECEWLNDKPVCNTINPKKYRSMDGSCNNLKETNYGRAFTPFFRILEAEYAPGTINGPRLAKDGTDLPSARLLSTTGQNKLCLIISFLICIGEKTLYR